MRRDHKRQFVEIECKILRETEKAFLVGDGKTSAWLPKSMVEWHPKASGSLSGTMVVPESLATDKGLV